MFLNDFYQTTLSQSNPTGSDGESFGGVFSAQSLVATILSAEVPLADCLPDRGIVKCSSKHFFFHFDIDNGTGIHLVLKIQSKELVGVNGWDKKRAFTQETFVVLVSCVKEKVNIGSF